MKKNLIFLSVILLSLIYFSCSQGRYNEKTEDKHTLIAGPLQAEDLEVNSKATLTPKQDKPVSGKSGKKNGTVSSKQEKKVSKNSKVVSEKVSYDPKKEKEILSRTNKFLQELHTQKEVFIVNSTMDNTFKTERGTVVKVPKDCFVNSKGMYERGLIKLEVKELHQISEMFMLDLPTVSDGKMLVSDGVFYINATAGGEQLKIWEGKEIEVHMAARKIDPEMLVFDLEEAEGKKNWTFARKPGKKEVERKKVKYSALKWEVRSYPASGKGGKSFSGLKDCREHEFYIKANKTGTEKDVEEFMERIKYISALEAISQCYFKNIRLDSYIPYYLNAPGHNFNSIDTKVFTYLTQHLDDFQSMEGHYCIESAYKQDTLYLGVNEIYDQFKLYHMKKNWMPEDLSSYGVDLDSRNPLLSLETKAKLSKEEAQSVLEYHKAKKEVEKKREKAKAHYNKFIKERETINSIGYAFAVNQLGYINIDKFYKEQNVVAANIQVKVSGPEKNSYAKVGMIFKDRKSFLPLNSNSDLKYTLSNSNLPLNDPVKIVAVIYQDEKIYYAEKDLKISSEIDENLVMKEISIEELKRKLN